MQHVVVSAYDPPRKEMFLAEAETIEAILGENCIAVHHIGSTAVEGLAAKPVIDILPVVRSLAQPDPPPPAFAACGIELIGGFANAGRR